MSAADDTSAENSAGNPAASPTGNPAENPAASPAGTAYDLPTLQAAGYETHGIAADPQWSAPFASIGADPSGFKPKASSPAKDHGKLLSYTSDFAGTAIPQGAGADIGAYEQ